MATKNDILQALAEKTKNGKIEWIPTAKSRWNSSVQGCRFSLMRNALDIYDRNKDEWYRFHASSGELDSLKQIVESRFPSQDRADDILAETLKCLADE